MNFIQMNNKKKDKDKSIWDLFEYRLDLVSAKKCIVMKTRNFLQIFLHLHEILEGYNFIADCLSVYVCVCVCVHVFPLSFMSLLISADIPTPYI